MNIESMPSSSSELIRLPKAKRTKTDMINSIVASYLERRNYSTEQIDNGRTSIPLSSEQMAVALFADKATARVNSILYSSINNEPKQVMQHYLKWLNWLGGIQSWRIQKELWMLARPLLCHLHVETLKANHQDQSQCMESFERLRREYADKCQRAFLNDGIDDSEEDNDSEDDDDDDDGVNDNDCNKILNINSRYKNDDISDRVLETLQRISTLHDIESHPIVMTFRSCKYRVRLTSTAIQVLNRYLMKHSHVILIQVLQTWFDIDVVDDYDVIHKRNNTNVQLASASASASCNNHVTINQNADEASAGAGAGHAAAAAADDAVIVKVVNNSKEVQLLNSLKESIVKMNAMHAPVLGYHLHSEQSAATCASIDSNFEYIACAFDSSNIRIYDRDCLPHMISSSASSGDDRIQLSCTEAVRCDEDRDVEADEDDVQLVLNGHSGSVYDVQFLNKSSPCPYLLSVSDDTTMRLWDYKANLCKAIYTGHHYPIWCMDVSAYGMYVATGSQDRTVRIWNTAHTYPLRVCAGHTLDVQCVKFHPNGLYVASGSSDRSIRLWNVSDASVVRIMPTARPVCALDFSPDGRYLASAGEDRYIHIWDLAVGSKLCELQRPPPVAAAPAPPAPPASSSSSVTHLLWSKDNNNNLYAGSNDGALSVWNLTEPITKQRPVHSSTTGTGTGTGTIVVEPFMNVQTGCTTAILNVQSVLRQIVYIGVT